MGKYLGHEGGTFMNEISTLIKRGSRELASAFMSCEGTIRSLCSVKRDLMRPCWYPDFGPAASRTVRKSFPLFNICLLCHICYSCLSGSRQTCFKSSTRSFLSKFSVCIWKKVCVSKWFFFCICLISIRIRSEWENHGI